MDAVKVTDEADLPLKVPAIELVDLTTENGVVSSLPAEVTQAEVAPSEEDEKDSDDQWEDEFLFEDALEGMGDEQLLTDSGEWKTTATEAQTNLHQLPKPVHLTKLWHLGSACIK